MTFMQFRLIRVRPNEPKPDWVLLFERWRILSLTPIALCEILNLIIDRPLLTNVLALQYSRCYNQSAKPKKL